MLASDEFSRDVLLSPEKRQVRIGTSLCSVLGSGKCFYLAPIHLGLSPSVYQYYGGRVLLGPPP